jgi:DNA-binding MarR family transcriptional regulator
LLRRVVSPQDRRARLIEITDTGAVLARRAHRAVISAERTVIDRVGESLPVPASDVLALCRAVIDDPTDQGR